MAKTKLMNAKLALVSPWLSKAFRGRLLYGLGLILLGVFFLAPGLTRAEEAVIAPGSAIVFTAGEQSKRNLMTVDPAGGLPSLLVDSPGAMDTQPAVGPEGQLAWIRQNDSAWDLIENGRVLGSGTMHLSPAYLPDGTLAAAVSGDEDTSIYIFSSGEKVLLAAGGEGGLAVSPAFSPDGSKVAYVSNQGDFAQIYIKDLNSPGRSSRLLSSAPVRNTDPAWSPKGDLIAFVTAEKDICLIRPDGDDLKQLTKDQGLNWAPAFSPDGQMIVFSSDRDGLRRLYVMNIDGGGQRLLLPSVTVSQNLPVWVAAPPSKP